MGAGLRLFLVLSLLLTFVACGGDSLTSASRVPAPSTPSPTPNATPTPTATATATATTPATATATAIATATNAPTATLPQPTTPPEPTPSPAPSHGQCNFSQPGSFICTIPAGVTGISITATGGGGGGGDACCDVSGGFTGLGGAPANADSATVSVPASGQTLTVIVGSGGPNGRWAGDPATRGGRGEASLVSDGAGSVLIQAGGGTGGLYCAGGHKSGLSDGQQACTSHNAGDGGLGGGCFTGGTEGCSGGSGAVSITW